MKRLVLVTTLIAVVGFAPLCAVAQDLTDEQIEQVQTHFDTGAKLYQSADYSGAIREFEAAHQILPDAIFLYNIALAYSKLGEIDKSLDYARRAEAVGGLSPEDSAQNRARIAAYGRVSQAPDRAQEISERVDPAFSLSWYGWAGTGLAVVGVLMLGATASIDSGLADEVQAYKDAAAGRDQADYERLKGEIERKQLGGRVLFFGGMAALLGGAGLVVYDLMFRGDGSETASWTLTPAPGGAVVGVSGSF